VSFCIRLPRIGTFDAWRKAARRLASAGVPPSDIDWGLEGDSTALFDDPLPDQGGKPRVPRSFLGIAAELIPDRSNQGMAVAYTLLIRFKGEPDLLNNRADRDVGLAHTIAKSTRRDVHKMKAFVRFRELPSLNNRRCFAAWFEPSQRIEEHTASFFVDRFGDMDWLIQTPEVSMLFEGNRLALTAEANTRPLASDSIEALWTTYYAHIFNPARLKVKAMQAEMPKKYWRNLPEAALIPGLIASAESRVIVMQDAPATTPPPRAEKISNRLQAQSNQSVEPMGTLKNLAKQAAACTRCPLHACATQTVFGEGPTDSKIMIVGEQPGDREDLIGRPFVGPAGQLFDRQASLAKLDRSRLYITNAVKHFKFKPQGKRRIHQRPNAGEIAHCRWWLDQERALIKPNLIIAMGGTALKAVTGDGSAVSKRRGIVEETGDGTQVLPTVHPSYLLRIADPAAREQETTLFQDHLRSAVSSI